MRSVRSSDGAGIRAAARKVGLLAAAASQLSRPRLWPIVAVLVGVVPLLFSFLTGWVVHLWLGAALLAWLQLGFVRADRWIAALSATALAFTVHSAAVIALAWRFPDQTAAIVPGGQAYWDKQISWIETGRDPEYELRNWVPAHLVMFAGSSLFTFSSLGVLTFHEGFMQVDLMNFYSGRLLACSVNRPLALVLGWHVWSVLRGVGYLLLTYEITSLAVGLCLRESLARSRRRILLWGVGLACLLADGLLKLTLLELVRDGLLRNLS